MYPTTMDINDPTITFINSAGKSITIVPRLTDRPVIKLGRGASRYQLYENTDDPSDIYILKAAKNRRSENFFSEKEIKTIPQEKQDQHINDIAIATLLRSVIVSDLVRYLFQKVLVVPEMYLHIANDGKPILISQYLPSFNEFLANKELTKDKTKPSDWAAFGSRDELNLSEKEAFFIGVIFGVFAIVYHKDTFNNITCANSGFALDPAGKPKACMVDLGNCLDEGFSGLDSALNAAENDEFINNCIYRNFTGLSSFRGCLPLDKLVYPFPPRLPIPDLFKLDGTDNMSRNVLEGCSTAVANALEHVGDPLLLQEIITQSVIRRVSCNSTIKATELYEKGFLNGDLYFPSSKKTTDTIVDIIIGRIFSTKSMLNEVHAGKTMQEIATKRLRVYFYNQDLAFKPCAFFRPPSLSSFQPIPSITRTPFCFNLLRASAG